MKRFMFFVAMVCMFCFGTAGAYDGGAITAGDYGEIVVMLVVAFSNLKMYGTDVDKNGQAEIWVTYTMHYASDVSPEHMKIIMYEGNKKHAIRGCNKVCEETSDCYLGGNYKADAAMRKNPVFLGYAKQLWEKMAIKDSHWHPSCAKKKQCSNPDCYFP